MVSVRIKLLNVNAAHEPRSRPAARIRVNLD